LLKVITNLLYGESENGMNYIIQLMSSLFN